MYIDRLVVVCCLLVALSAAKPIKKANGWNTKEWDKLTDTDLEALDLGMHNISLLVCHGPAVSVCVCVCVYRYQRP